jgi:catechol 2,3-dioxygenase-like lactoylglutathione lyase family enzyme
MIDHVLYEVDDLERAAQFYDAVFFALGARRMPATEGDLAWGVDGSVFEIAGREWSGETFGHAALRAPGKAAVDAAYEAGTGAGGAGVEAPGPRPEHGPRGYGAVLGDPAGRRVELLSR